ncbi:MAG: hypothetical protein GXP63_04535 [DPANN group archaeon]|nr:hypothetical protein [DPANN group archaeon]
MTKFVCKGCGYKVDKEKAPARCSYCGKDGSLIREKSAQDILDEVSKNSADFD